MGSPGKKTTTTLQIVIAIIAKGPSNPSSSIRVEKEALPSLVVKSLNKGNNFIIINIKNIY